MWRLLYETGTEALTLIIGLVVFRRLPAAYKVIVTSVAIAVICEFGGYYVGMIHGHHNAWIFNIYMILEQWLLTVAAMLMVEKKWQRQIMAVMLAIDTVIWIVNIAQGSFLTFAAISMVSGSIMLTICYLIVLFAKDIMTSARILRNPDFWLCVGILVYFSGDIPFMGLRNYLLSSYPNVAKELFNINGLLCKIRYPMTAVSFLLQARQHAQMMSKTDTTS